MTTAETLKAARHLIATKGWTQGELARDANGKFVPPHFASACQFCALGALAGITTLSEEQGAMLALHAVLPDTAFTNNSVLQPVAYFNDRIATSVDDVLALYDRAIARAEQGA